MKMMANSPVRPSTEFRKQIDDKSGQRIIDCYQCGKCTAGCPVAYAMDLTPRQVMRATQLGLKKEVLDSNAIWLCVSCQVCGARCPAQIDIPKVMETLRIMAITEQIKPAQREIAIFHRLFINLINQWGRVPELQLGGLYNLLSRHPLANIDLVPQMLAKGKLSLLPHAVKGKAEIKSIFARVRTTER